VFQPFASSFCNLFSPSLCGPTIASYVISRGSGILQYREHMRGGRPKRVARSLSIPYAHAMTRFRNSTRKNGTLCSTLPPA
jgi:hypothetical protein